MCHNMNGFKPYLLSLMLSPLLGLISELAMLLFQLWLSFENSLLDCSKALTIYLCSKCWCVFWCDGTKWTSSQVLKLWLPVWMYQVLFCMWLFMFLSLREVFLFSHWHYFFVLCYLHLCGITSFKFLFNLFHILLFGVFPTNFVLDIQQCNRLI